MSTIISLIPYFSERKLIFYSIDPETFKTEYNEYSLLSVEETFEHSCTSKETKAILFIFKDEDIKQKSELAKMFANIFQQLNIPFYCCSWNSILISATMLACIDAENGGDKNVGIIEKEMEYIFCREDDYTNFNVIKKADYYNINYIYHNHFSHFKNCVPDFTASKFCVTCSNGESRQNAITRDQKRNQKLILEKLGTSKNVINLTKNIFNYISKAIVAKTLKFHQRKPSKFDVANTGFQDYGIGTSEIAQYMMINFKPPKEYMKKFLIKIASNEIVPIKKTFVNFEKFDNLIMFEGGANRGFTGFSQNCVREIGSVISLSVTNHFMPEMDIRPLSSLPHGNKLVDNVTMICINENMFTVATIKNGKFDKIVLNNVPFEIAFMGGRIQIGKDAVKFKEEINSFIITDLLKILKTSSKDLKPDPKWGFQISNNNNENDDEILLEFDTFKGRRKASPTFLFAFFLRYSVKVVEVISGKMPETIVIVAKNLNDSFRQKLMNSCKFAKLNQKNVQIHEYKIVEVKAD